MTLVRLRKGKFNLTIRRAAVQRGICITQHLPRCEEKHEKPCSNLRSQDPSNAN